MANYIKPGTRVFVPRSVAPSLFGVLVKYGSDFSASTSGANHWYSGGWNAYVLVDGEQLPEPFTPRCVVKDTPQNRAKYLSHEPV